MPWLKKFGARCDEVSCESIYKKAKATVCVASTSDSNPDESAGTDSTQKYKYVMTVTDNSFSQILVWQKQCCNKST
jgi:hypothetical protein